MTHPPGIPYASVPQQNVDMGHLKTLSICHYVWGGLTMLFSCLFIFYIVLGFLFLSGKMNPGNLQSPPPPAFMGYMFIGIGVTLLTLGWTMGVLTIYSGQCIANRRRHLLSLVVAGFNCMSFPIGTTLGVFTFVVLLKQSVKELYP